MRRLRAWRRWRMAMKTFRSFILSRWQPAAAAAAAAHDDDGDDDDDDD